MTHHVQDDPLDAERIRSFLPDAMSGRPIEVHRVLTSTSDRLRELGREGAATGLAVVAEEQTHGRGSGGRRWVSRPGEGLWMSVLLRPGDVPPGVVTLGAGVAVMMGIWLAVEVPTELQWPNDLMVGRFKLCGILAEALPGGAVALGVGVNVHRAPSTDEIGREAIFLDILVGLPVNRCNLAAGILSAIEGAFREVAAGRADGLLATWRRHSNHLGERVRITMGEEVAVGVALDIDSTGALLLKGDDGAVRTIVSGSLELEPPSPSS
jgi:BirA family biotin operon repressor/biotin-[acetyl-CoA-carboxylase] ligase